MCNIDCFTAHTLCLFQSFCPLFHDNFETCGERVCYSCHNHNWAQHSLLFSVLIDIYSIKQVLWLELCASPIYVDKDKNMKISTGVVLYPFSGIIVFGSSLCPSWPWFFFSCPVNNTMHKSQLVEKALNAARKWLVASVTLVSLLYQWYILPG